MREYEIEINMPELISTIITLKSSEYQNENVLPRLSATSRFNFANSNLENGIMIDRYTPHLNTWEKVEKIDFKINCSSLVYRGAELLVIGGRNAQNQSLSTVNIRRFSFIFGAIKV